MSIPGLPALPLAVAAQFSTPDLLTSDSAGVTSAAGISQWGIFLNGEPVVVADNVVSVDYRQDFAISNYPVEQGAFNSYNKVQKPFEIRVRFSTGGSDDDRTAFLNSIQAIIGDLNLYSVVTPNATYLSANLTHQDYSRSSNKGAGLIVVDVGLEEVRTANLVSTNTGTTTGGTPASNGSSSVFNTGTSALISSPQSPTAAPVVNGGNPQAQTPTVAQTIDFNNAMPLP